MDSTHPDDGFLREYLKSIREELAWRRDLEFRLLQFLLVFYPIIGTATVTLYQSNVAAQVYALVSIGACLLILAASLFVTDRIRHEHKAYADMGRQVQKIWTYFGLFEPGAYIQGDTILPERVRDPKVGFGQGQGYKKTLILIWLVTFALVAALIALAVFKHLSYSPQP